MATTYPATLTQLKSRVQNRLLASPTGADHWDSTKLLLALNRAQGEVQDEILELFDGRYFIKTENDIVPDGKVIPLPPDWLRVLSLSVQTGESFLDVTIESPSKAMEYRYATPLILLTDNEKAQREVWSQIGENLESQLGDPGVGPYRLRYTYRIPDLQVDDDVTEIPSRFQELLVDRAASVCATDGGEKERGAILNADYQAGLDRLRRTAGRGTPNRVARVRRIRTRKISRWY